MHVVSNNANMIHQMPFYPSSSPPPPPPPPHMDFSTFFHPTTDAAESGLTFNSLLSVPPLQPAKRQRVLPPHHNRSPGAVSSFIHHHQMEIDRLISDHMEKLRTEVWRRRSGILRRIAAAAEGKLKAKEDEIEEVRRLNVALEERVLALSAENQIWRDVAQSNEATAQGLRNDLEAALLQQRLSRRHGSDLESCCDNEGGNGDEDESEKGGWRSVCRACEKAEATVLVLPCRHLCLCSMCSSGVEECALCGCSKQCTIHVNLS